MGVRPEKRYIAPFIKIIRSNNRIPERSKIWDMSYASGVRLSRCKGSKRRVENCEAIVHSSQCLESHGNILHTSLNVINIVLSS